MPQAEHATVGVHDARADARTPFPLHGQTGETSWPG